MNAKLISILIGITGVVVVAFWLAKPEQRLVGDVESLVDAAILEVEASQESDHVLQAGLDVGLPHDVAEYLAGVYETDPESIFSEEVRADLTRMIQNNFDSVSKFPDSSDENGLYTPQELGESAYEIRWREFVNNLELTAGERVTVRSIMTQWETFNLELVEQFNAGLIGLEDVQNNVWTIENLQDRLSPYLSADQLVDVRVNAELHMEFLQQQRQADSQWLRNAGYTDGIVDAASENNIAIVREFLMNGVDINATTADGRWNALTRAANDGNVETVQLLVDSGANINWVSSNHRNALIRAAGNGHLEVVRLLASEGADLEYHNPQTPTATALAAAAQENHSAVVQELLLWGAVATGPAGRAALNYALVHGNLEMEQMLREKGALDYGRRR